GEMLANFDNKVTIDQDTKDAWGIPVARIQCAHGENERAMAKDMVDTMREMATESGCQVLFVNPTRSTPGFGIHEVGTARMGNDPKKSVLNKYNQLWDVKNVFVTDGSSFVSTGCQNPTLTMMALTVRACEYIVGQFKRGEL
ncbi:MAG TPA: GMC family oxidoreductase, partial [Blastocatellia bacterium]|nr:GMC family oxidoreductase [Blastocatellia bacterium]